MYFAWLILHQLSGPVAIPAMYWLSSLPIRIFITKGINNKLLIIIRRRRNNLYLEKQGKKTITVITVIIMWYNCRQHAGRFISACLSAWSQRSAALAASRKESYSTALSQTVMSSSRSHWKPWSNGFLHLGFSFGPRSPFNWHTGDPRET